MHLDLIRSAEKVFPAVPDAKKISSLRVWYCKYATHLKIAEFSNLESLAIAGFPDKSFGMLVNLGKLANLKLLHMPLISDLGDLGEISSLESLSLATLPSWDSSGKVLTVASLAPLAKLPRLQHLELFGIVSEDRSLATLHECKQLKSLRVTKYPAPAIEDFFSSARVEDSFNPPLSFENCVSGNAGKQ